MRKPYLPVILSAAALLTTALPAAAQVNAEQVMTIGRNVLSMEDYMLAIQYFNQAIKAKPYLSDPYFFRAIAKLSLDDYKGAESDCSLAIERNKFKSEAYKVRGFARQHLGLDSLAIEDYNTGLEYNPIDKYFLFYKSVAQTEIADYDGAEATFSVLLRQYPKFEDGFSARARLNLLRGDTTAALSDVDHALYLSKTQVNPYLMKAEILSRRKEWSKALESMDEAVRLLPDEPDVYINRAYLRYNANDLFGAMSDYNYALQLEPGNQVATFNRALLNFEVRDLTKAADDFSSVLKKDPSNFHALYNRALIYMERKQWGKAQKDLQAIALKYPRFYPVYYALAQCRQEQGDLKGAFTYMNKADDLVRRYVDNPEKNPLDRPTIDHTATNVTSRKKTPSTEDDNEVMNKFNQLVTSGNVSEPRLSYNEKIKGRVQDRNLQVMPEPLYALSFNAPPVSLRALSNYFRALDNFNQRRYYTLPIHLVAGTPSPASEELIGRAFEMEQELTQAIDKGDARPVDYLCRGIVRTMLKNYPDAITDFDKAMENDPDFIVALMGRGYARWMNSTSSGMYPESPSAEGMPLAGSRDAALAVQDYDHALKLDPKLVYAWFNKGVIFYTEGDFTSALQCFSEAIAIDPDFGQAYYNRGLCFLKAGNSRQAFSDLSKAGELGIIPSYNLLKRLK